MWDLVGNPEDRFSHNEAHIKVGFQVEGGVNYTEMLACLCFTGQQTRTLTDLVTKIKQTTYLTTHQQKFDAFVLAFSSKLYSKIYSWIYSPQFCVMAKHQWSLKKHNF